AWARDDGRGRRAIAAAYLVVGAAALTAFWSVPLVFRLSETRALAWGSLASDAAASFRQPLVLVLVALAAVAPFIARTRTEKALAVFPWITIAFVLLDLVLETFGLRWL